MTFLKKIWGIVEALVLIPVVLVLIVCIFVLTVLGSFGRTWVIVREAMGEKEAEKPESVLEEVVEETVPPTEEEIDEWLRLAGIDVPKPPTPTNLN